MKQYEKYDDYLNHQGSKLQSHYDEIYTKNSEYREIVYERYRDFYVWQSQTVICLGARLGGEVEAFKRMGAVAVGIDLNPGIRNKHVMYGDFHEINFPDHSFDFVFCNSIDHVFSLPLFLSEIHRVLKLDIGICIIELAIQQAGEYETIETLDPTWIINEIKNWFKIKFESPIDNGWQGKLLILKK